MMMLLVKSPRTAKLNTMNTDSQAEHSVQWQPSWAHWMRTAMLDTVYDDSEAQHNERCQPSSTQWTMRAKIDSKQNDIQAWLTVKLETRYVDSQAWHKSQERQTCYKFQWQPSLTQWKNDSQAWHKFQWQHKTLSPYFPRVLSSIKCCNPAALFSVVCSYTEVCHRRVATGHWADILPFPRLDNR